MEQSRQEHRERETVPEKKGFKLMHVFRHEPSLLVNIIRVKCKREKGTGATLVVHDVLVLLYFMMIAIAVQCAWPIKISMCEDRLKWEGKMHHQKEFCTRGKQCVIMLNWLYVY